MRPGAYYLQVMSLDDPTDAHGDRSRSRPGPPATDPQVVEMSLFVSCCQQLFFRLRVHFVVSVLVIPVFVVVFCPETKHHGVPYT